MNSNIQGFSTRLNANGINHLQVKQGITIVSVDCIANRDVNVFIFQKDDRFVMKTTTKKRKRNDRFF